MKKNSNTIFFILFNIMLGCLLASMMIFFYVSYSPAVSQEIKGAVQKIFKEEFDCDWDAQVEFVDLLTLSIQFKNVSMFPCNQNDEWSLYTDTFLMQASWFDLIVYQTFNCHGIFDHAVVCEKQKPEKNYFTQVLAKMFANELSTQLNFDYITIRQGQVVLQDATGDLHGSYTYNCQMSREKDGLHTKLYILDGYAHYADQVVFEKLTGDFVIIAPYAFDLQEIYIRADCRLSIPALQDKGSCFLIGDVYQGRGAFVLSNEDQSFIIEPLKIRLKQHTLPITCSLTVRADLLQQLCAQKIFMPDLTGSCTISCTANLLNLIASLQTKLQINQLAYKNKVLIDQLAIHWLQKKSDYQLEVMHDKKLACQGVATIKENHIDFSLYNIIAIQPWWNHYWSMPIDGCAIEGTVDYLQYTLTSKYHIECVSDKLVEKFAIDGVLEIDKSQFACKGNFADKKYQLIIKLQPTIELVRLEYGSEQEVLFDFYRNKDNPIDVDGFVHFNFLKQIISDPYKSSFSQPGTFTLHGNLLDGSFKTEFATENAHIRIPSFYNVIKDVHAAVIFNAIEKSISCDNLIAHLYEGVVRCDHAKIIFDSQLQPSYLYMPLFVENVLMSWTKGIFGTVCGYLFLLQEQGEMQPTLQGNLIVDKAQLKGNIFSQEFQDRLAGAVQGSTQQDIACNLDVLIQTKEPVSVQTSFLQAQVHLDLHISNTIAKPEVEGIIDIVSGELKFPYKSLFITQGQILCMQKNVADPTIEFVAKGKIKRYDITMRATGTVTDQQIHFESSPYLTEEQIVALLLTGSSDSALSMVMPAMLMQKLQEIVFGPAMSQTKLDIMFHRLLQSFKNIRIFPQFTNQSGRGGGLRGVVEIDATERLYGKIDSNLMQLEDTIFEADYSLTDDVTIRAIKDGPSTYGGEVEMRWKFS
ncbi:MAG: translocation/assembly module TamB domain-containing protein [Candidatus Chromulinivorax sp.]